MRHLTGLLCLLLLPACARSEAPGAPGVLDRLLLARDSAEVPPVRFPHGAHADRPEGGCVFCHHTISDDPEAIPGNCRACHPFEVEDESTLPDL